MNKRRTSFVIKHLFLTGLLGMLLSGCGDGGFLVQNNSGNPAVLYKAEPSYDDTPKTITPESGFTLITVSGTAQFERRRFDSTVGTQGALSYQLDRLPIPCSEFNIYNSSGELVQAGSTNTDGTFSFSLSSKPATYTMVVRSRANNNCLKVSVLSDINSNLPYGMQKTLAISGASRSGFNLVASGDEAVRSEENTEALLEGGAFNILYQIYLANKFLRDEGVLSAGTSADKVSAYWKMGFTPYAYYGYPTSPISFYEPGQSKLYICGGIQGDVKSSDTDHFDDSVILHEYGHFLEDRYSKSDSPGGSHNGNFIIDPRLAWSEGWANFLQSAVKQANGDSTQNFYIDTIGYKTSNLDTTGFRVGVKFQLNADADNLSAGSSDKPIETGEGTFRELAVARTLFKTISSTYDGGASGASVDFKNIWDAFASFKDSDAYITNFALFANLLKTSLTTESKWASASTNITSIYTEERQPASTKEYGSSLSEGSSPCAIEMSTAVNDYYGSEWRSNQLRSNDFHVVYYNGSSPLTIELERTSGSSIDLDLNIYKRDYVYKELSSSSSNSTLLRSSTNRSTTTKESVNFSGLSAGYYVVNIKAYSAESVIYTGGTAFYQLRNTQGSSGGYLCPNNLNTL